ncbi:hypothetical protein R1flu_015459 [Riccia fluitans]|uniref:Dirigent protein n=1 Tax=Riccia fluitans TaxID=41844 RepID=A0ABD1YJE8_9MARC
MRPTQGAMTLPMMLVTVLAICSCGQGVASLETFTYYLHDSFLPPEATVAQVASANGAKVTAFDSPLRLGVDKESLLVGSGMGSITALKGINFITETHDITIPELKYQGSIAASGRFSFSSPSWQLAVTGGTGSFSGAYGHFTVSFADPNPAGYVLKYEASLTLPSVSACSAET